MTPARIAVVGAGLAGLMAARALLARGASTVTVFEKSRAPGGRAATRREGAHRFDHGAQYFTQRDARLEGHRRAWEAAGLVAPWSARLAARDDGVWRPLSEGERRWVAVPGMRALGEWLAQPVDVRYACTVRALAHSGDTWQVETLEDGVHGPYDAVLVTVPAPQAHALLAPHAPAFLARVARAAYQPCLAAMLVLAERPDVAWDGAFVNDDAVLAWVARNASKPGRDAAECWVLHARADWSAQHLDAEPATRLPDLLDAFARVIGARPAVTHAVAHRWRYAIPDPVAEGAAEAHHDATLGLGVAGDWCTGGRVEGALLSGLALADAVLAARG